MQEVIARILVLLRGAWRYRWQAVAAAWLIAILGWIGVQFIPDKFESKTVVYVDTESLLKPLLTGLAVNRDIFSQVAMMQAVMLSRPNLEKVAQKTDLLLGATTRREQEAVIDSLARRIQLGRPTGPGTQNTFLVSFENKDPQMAHKVVRTLLDTFMEDSLGLKRSDSGVAQRFLKSQIAEYEQKLTEAEQRLANFKQQNVGLMPGSGGDYYQRLETETESLRQMQQLASQLQNRRNELERQLQGEEPTFGLMGSAEGSPIDGQIARFKAQRDQLLLQYTEKHPQVQSLNDTIARLQEEKKAGAKVSSSVAPPGADISGDQAMVRSLDMNPVYQNLRISLSQADADLAEMRGQMAAQQAVVAELRSRVNTIPEVEAELVRLNRDYEVNKTQYDTLLQRLESARISESAEQNTDSVKFRVIEPPTVPIKPSGPVRPMLDSLVLLAALGAGLGLAILIAQMHPTFTTRDLLQKVTGIRVLGTVTAAVRADVVPWYRRQSLLVGGALSLLMMTYLLNLVLSESLRSVIRNVLG
ncbi:MAG: chain-length determining protein [Burkholderiaceae bacterium]|nr:chain-length determining protein [Burkholderiaceae bacterium]